MVTSCLTGNSFSANTLRDGGSEPIANVLEGDRVLGTDPTTRATIARPVMNVIRNTGTRLTGAAVASATESATHNLAVAEPHTYHVLAGAMPALANNCDLIRVVHAEYEKITTVGSPDYLSIRSRGPVLTGVKDETTGDIVTSLNHSDSIENLHPSLAARLGPDIGSLYPGGSGIHGEVHGLNELLWRRESAGLSTQIDDSFSYYSVRLRGAKQGMLIPPCPVCSRLTPWL